MLEHLPADFAGASRRTENLFRAGEVWSCIGVEGSGEMLACRDCDRGVKAREVASGERAAPEGDAAGE